MEDPGNSVLLLEAADWEALEATVRSAERGRGGACCITHGGGGEGPPLEAAAPPAHKRAPTLSPASLRSLSCTGGAAAWVQAPARQLGAQLSGRSAAAPAAARAGGSSSGSGGSSGAGGRGRPAVRCSSSSDSGTNSVCGSGGSLHVAHGQGADAPGACAIPLREQPHGAAHAPAPQPPAPPCQLPGQGALPAQLQPPEPQPRPAPPAGPLQQAHQHAQQHQQGQVQQQERGQGQQQQQRRRLPPALVQQQQQQAAAARSSSALMARRGDASVRDSGRGGPHALRRHSDPHPSAPPRPGPGASGVCACEAALPDARYLGAVRYAASAQEVDAACGALLGSGARLLGFDIECEPGRRRAHPAGRAQGEGCGCAQPQRAAVPTLPCCVCAVRGLSRLASLCQGGPPL